MTTSSHHTHTVPLSTAAHPAHGTSPEAAAAFAGLDAAAKASGSAIEQAFAKAAEGLTRSLSKASSDGKLSLADLARAAIDAADAFAKGSGGGSGGGGLAGALASALGSVFGGARADGGAVAAGGAYLVGERGPELFRPSASGEVLSTGAGGMTVNLTVQGATDPAAFARSDTQIAQALARAVRLGAG